MPRAASAQDVTLRYEPPKPWRTEPLARTLGLGFAGALTAFVAHEGGHLLANLLLGNVPRLHGTLVFGWLPFFVVSPDIACDGETCTKRNGERFGAGTHGKFFIVTAGFHVQHLTDEVLLSRHRDLRYRALPFQKGMLLFNVFLSCLYAAGAFTGLEDPHGDLVNAARLSRTHEAWLASLLLVPAALDVYRYFAPSARWTPWVSRGGKAALVGVNVAY